MSFDGTPDFKAGAMDRDTAVPTFYSNAVKNNYRSEREGKPVFEDVEYVTIRVPGDQKTEWDGPVTNSHRERFPREYAAFKSQMELPTEGTPLAEWSQVTRSQVLELAAAHVKTVEQLASLPDDLLNRAVSMGGFVLREKAQRFLKQAEGVAVAEKLAAESAEKDAKISELGAQIEALTAQVAKLAEGKDAKE